MIRKILLTLSFVISLYTLAQNNNQLFEKGNSLYKSGNYEDAIKNYESILNSGNTSFELYFNIANCYYKLNKVAPCIYFYEKALKFNTSNKEAKNNLKLAKRLTIDRIDDLPSSFSDQIDNRIFKKLSVDEWSLVTVVFSFLVSAFLILYFFNNNSSRKKLYFSLAIISLISLILAFSISVNQHYYHKKYKNAIVFSKESSVKSEPLPSAEESFKLHEGTKILVIDTVDNWKKIKLKDGKTGWLLSDTIKEI